MDGAGIIFSSIFFMILMFMLAATLRSVDEVKNELKILNENIQRIKGN